MRLVFLVDLAALAYAKEDTTDDGMQKAYRRLKECIRYISGQCLAGKVGDNPTTVAKSEIMGLESLWNKAAKPRNKEISIAFKFYDSRAEFSIKKNFASEQKTFDTFDKNTVVSLLEKFSEEYRLTHENRKQLPTVPAPQVSVETNKVVNTPSVSEHKRRGRKKATDPLKTVESEKYKPKSKSKSKSKTKSNNENTQNSPLDSVSLNDISGLPRTTVAVMQCLKQFAWSHTLLDDSYQELNSISFTTLFFFFFGTLTPTFIEKKKK
ncbi:hypothetical protein RFI_20340 [Reticulomyxa filosa]|uniref:Uncharacterized protein n=1 Tax=Reticulomyxa filosa TaxID=46433 RepID=X6MSQ5_RETFI|nr:hypothetical protein RFI_20340 [Reticulomyxa filosa]|eukprot:ETO16998.1 hypothetical protein RFI_20340 [Reticulomyxa filosa]